MQNLFRGYVTTKDKKCLMPFKNKPPEDLLTYDEVKSLPEYAGIVGDNVIVVDVDDYEQSEILMDIVEEYQLACRVVQTTRGKHFYFWNVQNGEYIWEKNSIKKMLACGIYADIRVGCKNSYVILRYDNKDREIIYDIYPDEEYQCLPKWLLPLNSKLHFDQMKAGDGRNQALFNYILTLQSNDFSMEEARQTLRIINDHLLTDPLDDKELETLSRDDAFKKPVFFKGNTFYFDKFAHFLASNHHMVKVNGLLHIYDNGIYTADQKKIKKVMIKHIPSLNRAKRDEVLAYLDIMVDEAVNVLDANYIAFRNGIFNLETKELEEFTPDVVITNKIDHDYIPDAYCELTDRTLDKLACGEQEIRLLLEEAIGYCFYRRNELRKCFILTGDKQNGKSTYLSMVEALLGRENISSLDLKELGDRFKTAELVNKLANIGDDIGDEFIANPAIFKKLVSGNPVNVERKGADPFDFSNYAKFLFSANNIPRIKDKSGAVISRLVIIPFDAKFSVEDPDFDPYIKYKLIKEDSMQYLIKLGLRGLQRVLQARKFTESSKVKDALTEYEENNNPILLFFKEEPKIENEPTSVVYQQYHEFCLANNFTAMSNIEFSKQVKKHLDYEIDNKTIRGKKHRVFVRRR